MYLKLSPVLNWSLKKRKRDRCSINCLADCVNCLTAFGKLMLQSTGGGGGFKP